MYINYFVVATETATKGCQLYLKAKHTQSKKKSKSKGQQLHESRLVSKSEIKSIRVISAAGK